MRDSTSDRSAFNSSRSALGVCALSTVSWAIEESEEARREIKMMESHIQEDKAHAVGQGFSSQTQIICESFVSKVDFYTDRQSPLKIDI